jgi:hypothetical protein
VKSEDGPETRNQGNPRQTIQKKAIRGPYESTEVHFELQKQQGKACENKLSLTKRIQERKMSTYLGEDFLGYSPIEHGIRREIHDEFVRHS